MSGRCDVCGCTDERSCPGGCIWANSSATLCSRCAQRNGSPLVTLPFAGEHDLCEACERGDHEHRGMQVWCACEHPCDGIAWTDDPLARAQGAWDNWDELEIQRELDCVDG
jgi:hypothetical protein